VSKSQAGNLVAEASGDADETKLKPEEKDPINQALIPTIPDKKKTILPTPRGRFVCLFWFFRLNISLWPVDLSCYGYFLSGLFIALQYNWRWMMLIQGVPYFEYT
jgi:hypothetical protein